MRSLVLIVVFLLAGCSDDGGDANSAGSGGSAGSSGSGGSAGIAGSSAAGAAGAAAGAGGSSAGSAGDAGGAGASGGAAGGAGGAGKASCEEASNPLFGSCIDVFLAGCYEPDPAGTCTSAEGNVSWSDGSKYVLNGAKPGLYKPGQAEPCIAIDTSGGGLAASKGAEKLTYTPDSAAQMGMIVCPDGSSLQATFDQVTAFNRCRGVNCPR